MEYIRPLTTEMLDLCLTLDPAFCDMENLSFMESSGEFVYLLGMCFCSNDIKSIKAFSTSRLWFTYRRNFAAIGGTGPTSDKGWGCMLRCGQMLLAQALSVIHLGRNWQWQLNCEDVNYRRLLAMFQDNRDSLFSIHQIAQMGVSEGKALGEWLGPNTIAQVLKKLVVYDDWSSLAVHVALDNILISEDVRIMASQEDSDFASDDKDLTVTDKMQESEEPKPTRKWNRPLLIIVPLRLGLTVINRCYLKPIQEFFKLPQCAGILGGRPNHAVYFYGNAGDKLLYLDPHTCQETIELKNTSVKSEQTTIQPPASSPLQTVRASWNLQNETPPVTVSCSSTTDNILLDAEDEVISANETDGLLDAEESSCSSSAGNLLSFSNSSSLSTSNGNSPSSLMVVSDTSIMDSLDTLCMSLSTHTAINETDAPPEVTHTASAQVINSENPEVDPDCFPKEENCCQSPSISYVQMELAREANPEEEEGSEEEKSVLNGEIDLFDDSTYHCPYLLNMDFNALDPSLALAFVCNCEDDYNDLLERLNTSVINASSPPLFEILESRPKGWPKFVPYVGHDDSLQLKEFDDFGDPQFDSDDQFELLE
uniref:Cysteine protease n=1 Tax=Ditylenchus dipsaci TaxID=166011 RepID=A0A915CSF9_9BILA